MTDKEYELTLFLFQKPRAAASRGHISEAYGGVPLMSSQERSIRVNRVRKLGSVPGLPDADPQLGLPAKGDGRPHMAGRGSCRCGC